MKGGDCSGHDQSFQMLAQRQTVSPLSKVSFCGYTDQIMYRLGKTSGDRLNFVDRHFVQSSLSPPNIFESRNLVNHNSINQNLVEQNLTPLIFDRQHFVDQTLNGKHLTSPFFEASKFDVLHADQDELALYEIEARLDSESDWDRNNADTFDFDEVWVNPLDFAISCTKQLHTRKLQNLWKRCQGLLPSLTSIATQTKLRKHTPLNHTFTRSPVVQKTVHTRSWPVKKAVLRKRARTVETETKVPKRTPHFDSVHTAVLQFCNTLPSIVDSRPIARRISRTRSLNTRMLPSFAQWTDRHNSFSDIQRARKWRNNVRRKRQPQYKCDRSGTLRALSDMNLGYHTEKPDSKFAVKIGSLRCDTLFGAFGSTCEFRSAITGEMATAGRSRAARNFEDGDGPVAPCGEFRSATAGELATAGRSRAASNCEDGDGPTSARAPGSSAGRSVNARQPSSAEPKKPWADMTDDVDEDFNFRDDFVRHESQLLFFEVAAVGQDQSARASGDLGVPSTSAVATDPCWAVEAAKFRPEDDQCVVMDVYPGSDMLWGSETFFPTTAATIT